MASVMAASADARSGFATASDGARLYYEEAGSGPPVVLMHQGLWDSRVWDGQMGPFAQRYRVVRYDLRGFGRSDPPTGQFSTRQDLADLMGSLGIERASLVAGSMSGSIAIDFALEFPSMVEALVLVAPGLSGDDTPDDERTERLAHESELALKEGDLERAVDLLLRIWTPLGDSDVDRRIREIAMDNKHVDTLDWSVHQRLDPPAAGRLEEIAAPTLVILGDGDAAVMSAVVDKVVSGIPNARRVVMPGTDHVPNMRDPETFNRVVLEFLGPVRP
jgi:pimeloyl-ACP methyl ester carboxylesterase